MNFTRTVEIAEHAGFCFGVSRAVEKVYELVSDKIVVMGDVALKVTVGDIGEVPHDNVGILYRWLHIYQAGIPGHGMDCGGIRLPPVFHLALLAWNACYHKAYALSNQYLIYNCYYIVYFYI